MSGYRLLVCVDRSRAALAAARLALRLAGHDGRMRVVSVLEDGTTAVDVDALGRQERAASQRLEDAARAVLERIVVMAGDSDVPVEIEILRGDPLQAIVRDARRFEPDLILIGRTARSGPGSPLVGSLAMHVTEFSDWPVVIVPETSPRGPTPAAG